MSILSYGLTIIQRVRSFEDACRELGIKPEKKILELENLGYNYLVADYKLTIIAKALNEGWVPNYGNGTWDKYTPYFSIPKGKSKFIYTGVDFWAVSTDIGARRCFKSRELAEYSGKHFLEIYNVFLQYHKNEKRKNAKEGAKKSNQLKPNKMSNSKTKKVTVKKMVKPVVKATKKVVKKVVAKTAKVAEKATTEIKKAVAAKPAKKVVAKKAVKKAVKKSK